MKKALLGGSVIILIALLFMIPKMEIPKGKWYHQGSIYDLPIKSIDFQDSLTTIVDEHGVISTYHSNCQRRKLSLFNALDTNYFDLRVCKDSIIINESLFTKEDVYKGKKPFEVDLLNMDGDDLYKNSNHYYNYYIGIKKINDTLRYILNQKICRIADLPIFLERHYPHIPKNRKTKHVFLFVDQSVTYPELLDLYLKLYSGNVIRVSIVTKKPTFTNYEGLQHKLDFWEEDMEVYLNAKYKNKYGIPPPPWMPGESKKHFFEYKENIQIIDKMDLTMIGKFKTLYKENGEDVLLQIKYDIEIRDYIRLIHEIQNHVRGTQDKVAQEMYGLNFEELTYEQRSEIWKNISGLTVKLSLR